MNTIKKQRNQITTQNQKNPKQKECSITPINKIKGSKCSNQIGLESQKNRINQNISNGNISKYVKNKPNDKNYLTESIRNKKSRVNRHEKKEEIINNTNNSNSKETSFKENHNQKISTNIKHPIKKIYQKEKNKSIR